MTDTVDLDDIDHEATVREFPDGWGAVWRDDAGGVVGFWGIAARGYVDRSFHEAL